MSMFHHSGRLAVLTLSCLLFSTQQNVMADAVIKPARTLPTTMPWDLAKLSTAPTMEWVDESGAVRSLLYRGQDYQGKPTRVFAYYATPGTLAGDTSTDKDLPAVVLVHGGGGTAFAEWVKLWAKRGYAAIAMDLAGKQPGGERLPDGGPDQSHAEKFLPMDRPMSDHWTYHAVGNVILAHSLIRSFPEVDAERTALTGISWGGYLTCIVAGLDNRFQAAVPVYGCGFLHDNSIWLDEFAKYSPEDRKKWVQLFDPSQYIGSAAMPVFFVNGTNDCCYWLDSYAKTYGLVQGERNLRITVRMPHGHQVGWAPSEIGLFIDQHVLGGTALPKIATPKMSSGQFRAKVDTSTKLKAAELHYTTGTGDFKDRPWQSIPAKLDGSAIVVDSLPADTSIWFVTVTDEREAVMSSELVFAKPVE